MLTIPLWLAIILANGAATVPMSRMADTVRVPEPKTVPAIPLQRVRTIQLDSVAGAAYFGKAVWLNGGKLAVADFTNFHILVFDTLGKKRGVIGRKGQGPGEFDGFMWIASGGDVILGGAVNMSSRFDSLGKFESRVIIKTPDRPFAWAGLIGALPGGRLVNILQDGRPGGAHDESNGRQMIPQQRTVLISDTDGTILRAWRPALSEETLKADWSYKPVWAPQVSWGLRDSAVYMSEGREYVIHEFRLDGHERRVYMLARTARPTTSADRDHYVTVLKEHYAGTSMQSALSRQLEGIAFASVFPAIAALLVDTDGTIWMQEVRASKFDPELWLVLTADGRLGGKVELPPNLHLRDVKHGLLLADGEENDASVLVIFRAGGSR